MKICPFIGAGHPFEPALERIREAVARAPAPVATAAARRTVRQHELKGVQDHDGTWRLDRFYASALTWNDARLPFDATTYHYSDAAGAGDWYRFPREPYLAALDHLADAIQPEVLQYVVLRRLTFRARRADGTPYIGKFKRRSRARAAYDALARIAAAARRHPLSFHVPAAGRFDETRHLFHQGALPGRPVSDLIDEAHIESLMSGVGRVLAELHALPVPNLPVADQPVVVQGLARTCDWIAFFRAAEGGRLRAVRDTLLDVAPRLAAAPASTCHGDYVCSHVLQGSEGWAVVDFDAAHSGDAHGDAAWLLSSLTQDVPLLHRAWRGECGDGAGLVERAVTAFVEGYQSTARHPLDRRRLLWHRVAAEIHMLGLMFTKDRFHPRAFDRSVALVERLARQLPRAKAGAA